VEASTVIKTSSHTSCPEKTHNQSRGWVPRPATFKHTRPTSFLSCCYFCEPGSISPISCHRRYRRKRLYYFETPILRRTRRIYADLGKKFDGFRGTLRQIPRHVHFQFPIVTRLIATLTGVHNRSRPQKPSWTPTGGAMSRGALGAH
jgi:hypothetical protein